MSRSPKLLSIVVVGRNDDYLGDFKYRLATCVGYAAKNIVRAGLQERVEIVIVDWNSDSPLGEAVTLPQECATVCRFIEVPPEVAKKYSPRGERFKCEAATNVGLRRAAGEFALFMPADVLLTQAAIAGVCSVLDGSYHCCFDPRKTALCVDRSMIPWQVVESKPTLAEWDRYFQTSARHLQRDIFHAALIGGYGALMLHRDLWSECQGFAEENSGWGASDLEWGMRVCQRVPWVSLAAFGVMAYDMTQRPKDVSSRGATAGISFSNHLGRGEPAWGLGAETLRISPPAKIDSSALQAPLVRTFVRPPLEAVRHSIVNLLQTRVGQLPGASQLAVNGTEALLLAIVSWHCQQYQPFRFLEFNCRGGLTTLAFATHCSFGEIYGVDDFGTFDHSLGFQRYLDSLPHTFLPNYRFEGYARIVTGPIATAFDRLLASFLGEPSFDQVVVRIDAGEVAQLVSWAERAFGLLRPGGLLLLTGNSPARYSEVVRQLPPSLAGKALIDFSDRPISGFFKE